MRVKQIINEDLVSLLVEEYKKVVAATIFFAICLKGVYMTLLYN